MTIGLSETQLKNLMYADSKIKEDDLSGEACLIPYLHTKWTNILSEECRILRDYESSYNVLYKEKFDYYQGRADDNIYQEHPLKFRITRSDVDIYISADEDIIKINKIINEQKAKITLIESYIKTAIANRSYQIHSAIEFLKWKSGQ